MSIKKILYRILVLIVAIIFYFIVATTIDGKDVKAQQSQNIITYESNKNSIENDTRNNQKEWWLFTDTMSYNVVK